MAAGLWPPNHTGARVSLEKCHLSPHGVYNYTDGARELTGKVETTQIQKTSLWESAHTEVCHTCLQQLEAEKDTKGSGLHHILRLHSVQK